MTQKRKLDLKELELEIPSIDSNETKIILGGNDYGGGNGQFDMWYWGGNDGGGNNHHGDGDDEYAQNNDNNDGGDLDHYFDQDGGDNAGDWDADADGRHEGTFTDLGDGKTEYMLQDLPSIEVQSALDCWMEASEFLFEFFDKDGVVSDSEVEQFNLDVMDWFKDEYGVQNSWEALLRGLDIGEHADNFMNHFFENDKLSDISELVQALNEGNPAYAFVDSIHDDPQNDHNTNHAVVIVGYEYDQDGNFIFICADSATGEIERYPADHIDYDGVYAIFGLK